jgi:hypothetical protein
MKPDLRNENRVRSQLNSLKNSDVLDGWEWVAPKQTRSCAYCLAMDGRRFPLDQDFEELERCENEFGCRCGSIPVINGWERPARTIGSIYFEELPPSDQLHILGPERYEKFLRGSTLETRLGNQISSSRSAVSIGRRFSFVVRRFLF